MGCHFLLQLFFPRVSLFSNLIFVFNLIFSLLEALEYFLYYMSSVVPLKVCLP